MEKTMDTAAVVWLLNPKPRKFCFPSPLYSPYILQHLFGHHLALFLCQQFAGGAILDMLGLGFKVQGLGFRT